MPTAQRSKTSALFVSPEWLVGAEGFCWPPALCDRDPHLGEGECLSFDFECRLYGTSLDSERLVDGERFADGERLFDGKCGREAERPPLGEPANLSEAER